MKKIFCLLVLFALSYAQSFTPAWKNCGATSDLWQATSVVFDKQPKAGKSVTAKVCGTTQDTITPASFTLQATQSFSGAKVQLFSTNVALTPTKTAKGAQYCFPYTGSIPFLSRGTFEMKAQPQDSKGTRLGCVSFSITV